MKVGLRHRGWSFFKKNVKRLSQKGYFEHKQNNDQVF